MPENTENKTTAGQGLGIAGLVLGLVAIPLAILGCTFLLGLLLGAAGVILSAIGLSQASKAYGRKGVIIAGLITSIVGTSIALMWGLFFATASFEGRGIFRDVGRDIREEVRESMEESMDEIDRDMEKTLEELEKEMEELEEDSNYLEQFQWDEEITDREFEELIGEYEKLISDYIDLAEKTREKSISSIPGYTRVYKKAIEFTAGLTAVSPNLKEEQRERFEEINKRYEEALEKVKEED